MTTSYPIPPAGLDDRLAFVGTSGSGKTYAAGTAVERLLRTAAKVVIVDPLGVWYGLRLQASGSAAAYPVVIFGGRNGDIPLSEHAGALIGETVAGMAESCIVDLSDFATKAAERRFMLAFLDKLYRRATGEPFHLVFDEADLWAPQKSSEPQLQNLMEQIVRRGRVKGFIPWLITQRPAVLSKDVLSQADGLVAMKLTSSQDRDALGAWIEGQADRADEKRMLARLPQLERGQGLVWIPGRGVLSEVKFPKKETFDSSSTPKRGETKRTATLRPIDIGKVKERLASIEEGQKKPAKQAPAAQTRPAAAAPPATPNPRALREAEDAGRRLGFEDGKRVGFSEGYRAAQREAQIAVSKLAPPDATVASIPPRAAAPKPAAAAPSRAMGRTMAKAERRILTALAQYPAGRTKVQVAVLTGYAVNGGGFNNALGALRSAGFMEGSGTLRITQAGVAALGAYDPLPQGPALLEHWLAQLGKAERSILQTLHAAYPGTLSKAEVADAAGYAANGGGFNNALGRLRTLELIRGSTELAASADLFDEAA